MTFTVAQREGIRSIQEGLWKDVPPRTLNSLVKRGFVDDSEKPYRLTATGKRAYNQIVASGNGPERLKDMFRF